MPDLYSAAGSIVRQTREMLLPGWGNTVIARNKGGGAIDVVTELDMQVEKFLASELAKIAPDIAFAGEEFGGGRDASRFWLCDPIDGTGHYVRGLPFCTVMLALIEDGKVTLAYIYDFVKDELYHAKRGGGAFRNEEPIRVSDRTLAEAYLSWETHIDKEENLEKYMQLREKSHLIKTLCAGWEFAMIASGKLEGRVHFDPYGKDWDYAPGSLLVEEAGGVVANIGMNGYSYANLDFIAANKHVYEALTAGTDALFPIA